MTIDAAAFDIWATGCADDMDTASERASEVLPKLASCGFLNVGVPADQGGSGGDVVDGVAAISAVAEQSLAAAFVLWSQKTYIEYLLQSPNAGLRESSLPALLSGQVAGATGLSNAMKFLAGLEPLQISAASDGEAFVLDGKMPWVTNLRPQGFHVAAAVDRADGGPAFVASLVDDDEGLERSADLALMGMRSTNTAAIALSGVRIDPSRVIAERAAEWLPRVRPGFVGLQCGMSIGLARRSLSEAADCAGSGRGVLGSPIAELRSGLDRAENRLAAGLRSREFETNAPALFELRIELAEIVSEAISLELQASGGRAYLAGPGKEFGRRWREAAFIPIITPSLVQLKAALQKTRAAA